MMDFFLFKLAIGHFNIFFFFFFPLSTSSFVRVLVFCLAHLLPFLGEVTLPWLDLMGANLSLLLSLTLLTFSVCLGLPGWFHYNLIVLF